MQSCVYAPLLEVVVHSASNMAFSASCSLVLLSLGLSLLRQTFSKWFGRPQASQFFP